MEEAEEGMGEMESYEAGDSTLGSSSSIDCVTYSLYCITCKLSSLQDRSADDSTCEENCNKANADNCK